MEYHFDKSAHGCTRGEYGNLLVGFHTLPGDPNWARAHDSDFGEIELGDWPFGEDFHPANSCPGPPCPAAK